MFIDRSGKVKVSGCFPRVRGRSGISLVLKRRFFKETRMGARKSWFTDLVATDGKLVIHKLLSENPSRYKDAPVQGIQEILGIDADAVMQARSHLHN